MYHVLRSIFSQPLPLICSYQRHNRQKQFQSLHSIFVWVTHELLLLFIISKIEDKENTKEKPVIYIEDAKNAFLSLSLTRTLRIGHLIL